MNFYFNYFLQTSVQVFVIIAGQCSTEGTGYCQTGLQEAVEVWHYDGAILRPSNEYQEIEVIG